MVVVRRLRSVCVRGLSAEAGRLRPWAIAALGFVFLALALAGGEVLAQSGGCARCGGAPAVSPSAFPFFVPAVRPARRRERWTLKLSLRREPERRANYTVCVRTCDGAFFPVSYFGPGSRSDTLEQVCRSLCPNADVALYSFPFGGTIDEAVSSTGERYVDMPNALKFQQSFDSTCSCRRKGETWAQALANAEAKYGHDSHDILVTPEKSAEMSRPIVAKAAADSKAKPAKSAAKTVAPPPLPSSAPADATTPALDANGADTALSTAAAAVSREASGIAGEGALGGTRYSESQGQTVTETGPDGVKRKVRIVGPTL